MKQMNDHAFALGGLDSWQEVAISSKQGSIGNLVLGGQ